MLVLDEKKILQYYIDKVDLESNPIVPSIHILLESVSTNSEMKDFLKQGVLPEGAVFLTDYQTAGRGRQGKSFYSPRGMGLYFSIFTRPKDKQGNAILITTHAAVAVVRAIEELYGISLSIKWVNDLFLQGKKICGILAEGKFCSGAFTAKIDSNFTKENSTLTNPDQTFKLENGSAQQSPSLEYCIMGIGINLFTPLEGYPRELENIAGSLFGSYDEEKCKEFDRNILIATILYHYFSICNEEEVLKEYREKNLVLGKTVYFEENGVELQGKVIEISPKGELKVELDSGEEKLIFSGEIHFNL